MFLDVLGAASQPTEIPGIIGGDADGSGLRMKPDKDGHNVSLQLFVIIWETKVRMGWKLASKTHHSCVSQ
jgi:hypothetical protein